MQPCSRQLARGQPPLNLLTSLNPAVGYMRVCWCGRDVEYLSSTGGRGDKQGREHGRTLTWLSFLWLTLVCGRAARAASTAACAATRSASSSAALFSAGSASAHRSKDVVRDQGVMKNVTHVAQESCCSEGYIASTQGSSVNGIGWYWHGIGQVICMPSFFVVLWLTPSHTALQGACFGAWQSDHLQSQK